MEEPTEVNFKEIDELLQRLQEMIDEPIINVYPLAEDNQSSPQQLIEPT